MFTRALRLAGPLCALVVCPATAAGAEGVTLIAPDGTAPARWQRVADRAKAPTAPIEVMLTQAACPDGGVYACAYPYPVPHVYLDWPGLLHDADRPAGLARASLYHELGHVFDWAVLDDADRAAFLRLARAAGPWQREGDSPHERFAEAYRLCAQHGPRPRRHPADDAHWNSYGWTPTRRTHRRACALIERAPR